MSIPAHRVVLALALAACASSPTKAPAQVTPATTQATPAAPARTLAVVGINDTHGALLEIPPTKYVASVTKDPIGGADWFAGWVAAIRADARERHGEVVVLDGGDQFQGTLISNQFEGRSVTDCYNAIGLTAAAVGNHEFDFGREALLARMQQAKFPILAANIFKKGTRTRPDWARPSVLIDQGGIKIGIIGLSTVETPLTTNPLKVQDLDFAEGGPVAAQEADALRAQGATVVLITAHMGPLPPSGEIRQVAEAVRGKVDAIVSGHNHTVIDPPLVVAGIPIVQSGSKLQNFSIIELQLDANNRVQGFKVNEGNVPRSGAPQPILHTVNGRPASYRGHAIAPDAQVTQILAGYDAQVKKLREERIGETEVELDKAASTSAEDLLSNLASDALRSGDGGGMKADIAFQNAGGLRISEIPKGPITFGQIFDLIPFDNTQVVVTLTAAQVRDALEAVLHHGKGPMRVSGLKYTIDYQRFAPKDLKAAPAGALVTRVTDASGKLLCETKSCTATACEASCSSAKYTVAVTDFLSAGGDGLTVLKDAPRQVAGALARDMVVAFVKAHQPLTAKILGGDQGPRITQLGAPPRARNAE